MSKTIQVWGQDVVWTVLLVVVVAAGCWVEEVIRFRVEAQASAAWVRDYWSISDAGYTIQPGDSIEYDVYVTCRAPGVGGIDVKNTDGTDWRDMSGWQDENGISGHPNADISALASGKWYHRKLPVPTDAIGKTVSRWEVAVDGYYAGRAILSALYDNIRLTNGGATVLTIYDNGAPDLSARDFSRGVSSDDLLYGPVRRPQTQVGAYLFYWYDAPNNNADPNLMPYHPYGLVNDPWTGYNNGYYSMLNQYWWEAEFADMRRAGVDVAALVCWGDSASVANYMVPALERSGCGIKIALFDDTTSECCEWNVDQGRSYYPHLQMPLSDQANWSYFYDRKIKPLYNAIPKKYWATHNGASLEDGGRPIIITYVAHWFSGVSTNGTSLWQWVKDRFAADFKDANGVGIVPWLIHDDSWSGQGGAGAADGRTRWGTVANYGFTYHVGDYSVSQIGPGYDDRKIRSSGQTADRYQGARLIDAFNWQKAYLSDLVMLETWNELWEGTSVQRCKDYPSVLGGYLPETFYMDISRDLVMGGIGARDLDATFLRTWEIPATFRRAAVVSVSVRNDGLLPWTAGSFSLGGRLLYSSTGAVIPGTERTLATLGETVATGSEVSIGFNVPSGWPNSVPCLVQLDMMQGSDWFASAGDLPVTKSINLQPSDTTAPSRVSSFTASPGQKSILLSWHNPSTADFRSTVIRVRTSGYPSSVADGSLAAHRLASPNTDDSCVVANLVPGVTYYFSAFAQDAVGNVSGSRNALAVPLADTTAPAPVSDFTAGALTMNDVAITWKNPSDLDYQATVIRYSTSGYPLSPADGLLVCAQSLLPGSGGSFVHERLTQGHTYYYSAFACDSDSNCSPAAHASITLPVIDCATVRLLPDNVEVELRGNVVTGIYPDYGGFYIEQPDRIAGIRVAGSAQGLAIGDRVDVVGKIATYRPDGQTPVERELRGTVTKTGHQQPLEPLMMNCRSVGGEAIPPCVPGVNNPHGPNNIGLLVRIAGRVTQTITNYLLVDDGSSAHDIGDRIGVLVGCPGTPYALVGQTVVVTGVACGRRPYGWQTNCRLVRLRDWDDLVVVQEQSTTHSGR